MVRLLVQVGLRVLNGDDLTTRIQRNRETDPSAQQRFEHGAPFFGRKLKKRHFTFRFARLRAYKEKPRTRATFPNWPLRLFNILLYTPCT